MAMRAWHPKKLMRERGVINRMNWKIVAMRVAPLVAFGLIAFAHWLFCGEAAPGPN